MLLPALYYINPLYSAMHNREHKTQDLITFRLPCIMKLSVCTVLPKTSLSTWWLWISLWSARL